MSPAAPASPPRSLVPLGIVGGWVVFTLMVIAISWTGALLRGRPAEIGGTLVWNLGWMLWAGATFPVIWLVRRFPLERGRLASGIVRHASLGIAIGVALLVGEFLFARGLQAVWPGAPRANAFLGFIVYKFHVYFLIYWLILGATRAYDLNTRLRAQELHAARLETRLAQAQLHALQTQLQPHFLFNTHHAIVSLMLKSQNAAAITMLTRLSDLLRITLRKTDRQVTSLQEELDALELYLGIQRERYGDRLAIEREIDPAALSAEVPWLVLQPIVENALKHGIDSLSGAGRLRIQAQQQDGRLCLGVSDNGAGFPPEFTLDSEHPGIGLKNTRERLARLYGSDHAFQISGSEVRITIPFRAHVPTHE